MVSVGMCEVSDRYPGKGRRVETEDREKKREIRDETMRALIHRD
jgi:hypothetical protein